IVRFSAGDGAVADCHVPFPPLTGIGLDGGLDVDPGSGPDGAAAAAALAAHARAVAELREDPRLSAVFDLASTEAFLTVPDPRPAVLAGTPRRFRAVRIRLIDS
ncbi:Vms1/Ankzf1 family peptidyl-tRNA hydrolase, partial [Actinomadura sp. HBU206391]|uniref:Vms1/Ankzf1 family peptidyl-tRNA hydrolase n=1 Tax=Actinomadura sp. HBU206391 TaxID=2731692 RepID=UPI001D53F838